MSRESAEFVRADPTPLREWLNEHYGIGPAPLEGFSFWSRKGLTDLWIAATDIAPPKQGASSVGTQVWRERPPAGYLSTAFIRLVGNHATKNVFDLEDRALAKWFAGGTFEPATTSHSATVIIRHKGVPLGRARKFGKLILSELPKHMRVSSELLHTFGVSDT